jgi:hypothetical protein
VSIFLLFSGSALVEKATKVKGNGQDAAVKKFRPPTCLLWGCKKLEEIRKQTIY